MITEQDALKLLKTYIKTQSRIQHSIGVADIAFEIANKIKNKNPEFDINPQKIKIAGLLHDIGKETKGVHELNSIEILKKHGLEYLANIIMHGFHYEFALLYDKENNSQYLPNSIENKIVAISDLYFNQQNQRVNLDQRFKDILQRYENFPYNIKAIKLAKSRFKKLEKEIISYM